MSEQTDHTTDPTKSDRSSEDNPSLDPENELSAEGSEVSDSPSLLAETSAEPSKSFWSVLGKATQVLKDSPKGAIEGTSKVAVGHLGSIIFDHRDFHVLYADLTC